MRTDVIACRLSAAEADRFRRYARERDLTISGAIKELVGAALAVPAVRR